MELAVRSLIRAMQHDPNLEQSKQRVKLLGAYTVQL